MPGEAAGRLATIAADRVPGGDLVDGLAEALLELPATLEVHVRRWADALRSGLAVGYWPGEPVRCRSYIASSWESAALREAVQLRQPVMTVDPAELPSVLVGRMTHRAPLTILPLGTGEEPWGVVVVAQRPGASLGGADFEAMATLVQVAGPGVGPAERPPAASPVSPAAAMYAWLADAVSGAERRGSEMALLVIRIEQLGREQAMPGAPARLAHTIERALDDEFGEGAPARRLTHDTFGVVLSGATVAAAATAARRVVHRLGAATLGSAGNSEPVSVLITVVQRQAWESARAFLTRGMSHVGRSPLDIRGSGDALAGPSPNLLN